MAPELVVNLVGVGLHVLKLEAAADPAVKKGARQSAHACASIQQAARLQCARREQRGHEPGRLRWSHKLAEFRFAPFGNPRGDLTANFIGEFKLLKHI